MPTNLAIDDDLIQKAKDLGCHNTKRDAVNAALREYIQRRQQKRIIDLFGKVEYFDDFDHKDLR